MASSSRRSSAPKRSSSHGLSTPDRKTNPTVLARKKRSLLNQKDERVTLERVLGLTCVNGNGLAVSSEAKCIAYPAGCVVVLYYPKQNKQIHLINPAKKHISCVTFSPDGKYLAAGECGHQPCVRVWDVATQTVTSELQGHSFGISCVKFSPNLKYLVSVGYQHDMMVCLWNWKTGVKIASNKVSSKVGGVDFCEDGGYFVTVGHRHVRYWYIKTEDKTRQLQPLQGRSAVLGEHLKESFVSVCCGKQGTATNMYCISKSGKLCMFNERRVLDQFIELQVPGANCLAISEQYIFCGCNNGTIRLYDPYTLEYVTTLPKPHHLGITIAAFDQESPKEDATGVRDPLVHPNTVAVGIDMEHNRLSCVYNDHSLYVWDLRNIKHIGKLHSFLYHNACVWDVDVNPDNLGLTLPPNCFATCSSDCTIRFWCIDANLPPQWKNIYSKELLRIIYTDRDTSNLKDSCSVPGVLSSSADATKGVRTLKFRPNGQQLAIGDRTGNLQLYDLQFMDKIREVEAHDSEILCVEFSSPELGHELMATASRDRLVHVFDASNDYQFLQTLDEHSSAITSVKFALGKDEQFQLISCGADKSIMFRSCESSKEPPTFQLTSHIAGKATLYDMVTDVTGKFLATAGQDRNVRIYHIATGKKRQSYKAGGSEEGTLIKVALDPSSSFIATSSSDKSLCLFDFYSGEVIAKLYGHSEVITGIKFSRDLRRIYTTSGDGCIFVWHLSTDLSQGIYDRLVELDKVPPNCPEPSLSAIRRETYHVQSEGKESTPAVPTSEDNSRDEPDFRFSISELPRWAQKQLLTRPSMAAQLKGRDGRPLPVINTPATKVSGKWAERIANLDADGRIVFAHDTNKTSDTPSPASVQCTTSAPVSMITGEEIADGTEDVVEIEEIEEVEEIEEIEEVDEEVVYLEEKASGKETSVSEEEKLKLISPVKVASMQIPDSKENSPEKEAGCDDETASVESPMSPYPPPFVGLGEEVDKEEVFLKTNFESLTAEKADAFFGTTHSLADVTSSRLSISTKFLSKSLDRRNAHLTFHVSQPASAPLIGRNIVKSHSQESVDVLASPVLLEARPLENEPCPLKDDTHTLEGESGGNTKTSQVHPELDEKTAINNLQQSTTDTAKDRKPTLTEEVYKARKRLQELGWSLTDKEDSSSKVIAVPSIGAPDQIKPSSADKILSLTLNQQQICEGSSKVETAPVEDFSVHQEIDELVDPGRSVCEQGELSREKELGKRVVTELCDREAGSDPHDREAGSDPHDREAGSEPHDREAGSEPHGREAGSEPHSRETRSEPHGREAGSKPLVREAGSEPHGREAGSEPRGSEVGSEPHVREAGSEPHVREAGSEPHDREAGSEPHVREAGSEPHDREAGSELHGREVGSEPHGREAGSELHSREAGSEPHSVGTGSESHDVKIGRESVERVKEDSVNRRTRNESCNTSADISSVRTCTNSIETFDFASLLVEIDQVQEQLAGSYQSLERLKQKVIMWNEHKLRPNTREPFDVTPISKQTTAADNTKKMSTPQSVPGHVDGLQNSAASQEDRMPLRLPSIQSTTDQAVLAALNRLSDQFVDMCRQKLGSL